MHKKLTVSGIRVLPHVRGSPKSFGNSPADLKKAAKEYARAKHPRELRIIRIAVKTKDGAEGFVDFITRKGKLILVEHPLAEAPKKKKRGKAEKSRK